MKRLIAILFFLSLSCDGATTFLEAGTNQTRDMTFYPTPATGVSDATRISPAGPNSLKIPNATTAIVRPKAGILADAGSRCSMRFMCGALPPTTTSGFYFIETSGNVTIGSLGITTAGKIQLNLLGVGTTLSTTSISAMSPYLIQLSYTITNSTTFTFNVFLNQRLEISVSNSGTLTTIGSDHFSLRSSTNFGSSNVWFADLYCDNSSALNSPGNIIVTAKRPVSAGAANNWTTQIGSGGSGYGTGHAPQVNEQPLSTTNGWSIASASLIVEEYTIEGASVGDLDVSNRRYTLVDWLGWVWFKTGTADTRNIIIAGSATNISATTAYALYTKVAGSTTYPSTNTAIGMNNNSLVALASLGECGILLAYKLPRRVSITP